MIDQARTIPAFVTARLTHRSMAMNVLIVISASLLLAISAQIAVPLPFSTVPMTLQPLALLLIGASLGTKRAFSAASLYLIEGMSGLPVFAHGIGGVVALLGPTAGYLWAFPFGAAVAGALSERGWTRTFAGSVGAMTLALSVVYFAGWSWLATVMQLGAEAAFVTGVVPFIMADVVKIAIAAMILPIVQKLIARS